MKQVARDKGAACKAPQRSLTTVARETKTIVWRQSFLRFPSSVESGDEGVKNEPREELLPESVDAWPGGGRGGGWWGRDPGLMGMSDSLTRVPLRLFHLPL